MALTLHSVRFIGSVMVNASLFKSLYFFGLALLMLMVSVVKSFGQKVYATNYGMSESGSGITYGLVQNPTQGVNSPLTDWTRLSVLTLLGSNENAHYQLKFTNTVSAGTKVFIRINSNVSGILGLLLTANGAITVQQNAQIADEAVITGTQLSSHQTFIDTITINNDFFVTVTPQLSFNSVTVSLTQSVLNLLGLELLVATLGSIDVYYAYYECGEVTNPSISIQ